MSSPSRNQPCPCGSGVKYKKCCGRGEPPRREPAVITAPSEEELLDPLRWLRLKALRRRDTVPSHYEHPRAVGAAIGLWPAPSRPLRPPRDTDYDALAAALVAGPDPVHVWLEHDRHGGPVVLLDFPFDERLNAAVKRLPGRRFEYVERVWSVPATPAAAPSLAALLEEHPWLNVSEEVEAWLRTAGRWSARVGVWERDGEGVFVVRTVDGRPPAALEEHADAWHAGWHSLAIEAPAVAMLQALDGARLDANAEAACAALRRGAPFPGAWLELGADEEGEERFELRVGWRAGVREAALALQDACRTGPARSDVMFAAQADLVVLPADPALAGALDEVLSAHPEVSLSEAAAERLRDLCERHERARATVALSQAHDASLELPPLGGTLEPFQRAGVAYALRQRRTFIADEQGLGKTVQALAALETAGAFPAVVVCPASLKLNWQRETARWLPHRSATVLHGRRTDPASQRDIGTTDVVIVNYDILDAHLEPLCERGQRGVVFDESHYVKEPRAKRTQAAIRLGAAVAPDGLHLALTGTPILNRPKELVAQLRVIGRLDAFGSGARLGRRFRGPGSLERLHWHLRAHCFVRRTKAEVLPQLPSKRIVALPVALDNQAEYRLAEDDIVAWLRSLPLDLRTLEAREAAALRNERLVRLNHLRHLAGRGKLRAALAWIDDFAATGEPLVVFAEHIDVQRAVLERNPGAAHVLGADGAVERDDAVQAFQRPGGPPLIVCSLKAASQGLTLTRASNVAFLELDWTPARHDQAEDRCHRMGQDNAVTAWYLLAPDTIDDSMAEVLRGKRAVIGAVTDGRAAGEEGVVEAVARDLRDRAAGDLRASVPVAERAAA